MHNLGWCAEVVPGPRPNELLDVLFNNVIQSLRIKQAARMHFVRRDYKNTGATHTVMANITWFWIDDPYVVVGAEQELDDV